MNPPPPSGFPHTHRDPGDECLVLLRGLTREGAHWGGFAERAAEMSGLPTILVDLPGFGSALDQPSPSNVASIATLLRGSSAWRKAPPRKHILGQSLGSMAAAELARAFPSEVASLLLVNGSAAQLGLPWERFGPAAWGCAAKGIRHWVLPSEASARAFELSIHRATCEEASSAEIDIQAWTDIRRLRPGSAANAARQLLAAARFRAPAKAPARALVACSARDKVASPECSRRLARLWGCPLAEHPWAGHDLAHDDPQWLLDVWRGLIRP